MSRRRTRVNILAEELDPRRLLAASVAGSLDPGLAAASITASLLVPRATAVRPDGVILVAAAGSPLGSAARDFHVSKVDANNRQDFSIDLGGTDDVADIALLPDAKIILVGRTLDALGTERVAVARLNTDFSYDRSFSGDGRAVFDGAAAGMQLGGAVSVAVQTDGRLLVGCENAVLRINTNGTLDTSFSSDGIARLLSDGRSGGVRSIGVMPNGEIVAAAFVVGFRDEIMVARLNPNGSLDRNFSGDGRAFFGGPATPQIMPLSNGKTLLTNIGGVGDAVQVRRINPDGSLDTSIGNAGSARIVLGQFAGGLTLIDAIPAMARDRFLAVGRAGGDIFITQFGQDGVADPGFGVGGIALVDGYQSDTPSRAAVAPDGKIVVGVLGTPDDPGEATDPGQYRTFIYRFFGTQTAPSAYITRTGTLLVQGSELAETITLEDDQLHVNVSFNGVVTRIERGKVRRIAVRGGGGSDVISAPSLTGASLQIAGENGNDTITANGRDNLIFGGVGDDWLYGVGGDDTINGDAGDDHLFGGSGNDSLIGGDGADTLTGDAGEDRLQANAAALPDQMRDELFGGSGRDHATASAEDVLLEIQQITLVA